MKQVILSVLVCAITVTAFAQTKAVQTAKIKTPTVVCEKCKDRIETYLKRYDGILSTNVNYRSKETTVKYLSDRTNIEEIKTAIANAGYDADEVTAEETAYKKLPKCCKRPDEPAKVAEEIKQ